VQLAPVAERLTEEMNRLRREHRAQLALVPREVAGVSRRSQEILKLALEGFRNEEWKDELRRIDKRRAELEAVIAAGVSELPRPALVFREKTTQLAAALEDDQERDAARQALPGFLDKIVIPPGDGLLQVIGNFGEMPTAASGRNGSVVAAVGYVGCGGATGPEPCVELCALPRLKSTSLKSAGIDTSLTSCKTYPMTRHSLLPTLPSKEALILDLLLREEEMYGLQLVAASGQRLKRGTVYVTLGRMEEKGYIVSRLESPAGAGGLPRRQYKATALGRRVLSTWARIARQFVPETA
jgi:hypothetical protein